MKDDWWRVYTETLSSALAKMAKENVSLNERFFFSLTKYWPCAGRYY